MRILILLLIAFTFSCKKQNSFQGKAKPIFKFDAYSVNYSENESYKRRKELLHVIYAELTNDESNKLLSIDQLSVIPLFHKTSIEHDQNFARLIVSYNDHEEMFYIPIESTKEWLLSNLNLKRDSSLQSTFINSTFKRNETSYLVFTKKDEVLLNEVYFQEKTINFEKTANIKLDQLTKYQKIKVKINSFKNIFEIKEFAGRQHQAGRCYIIRKVNRGGEGGGGGDVPVPCTCEYKIFKPVPIADAFEPVDMKELKHQLILNNVVLDVSGDEFEVSLKNENNFNEIKLNFFNDNITHERIKGIKQNEYCVREPEENVTIKTEMRYEVQVNVMGTSLIDDQILNLPKVIE